MINYSTNRASNIIADLMSMPWTLYELGKEKKPYLEVLNCLRSKGFEEKSENGTPTLLDISRITGLSNNEIKEHLNQIYNDVLQNAPKGRIFNIHYTFYIFRLSACKKEIELTFDSLSYIPKVGETIEIPFFTSHLYTSNFIVKSMSSRIFDNHHYVFIDLKESVEPNPLMFDDEFAQGYVASDRRFKQKTDKWFS